MLLLTSVPGAIAFAVWFFFAGTGPIAFGILRKSAVYFGLAIIANGVIGYEFDDVSDRWLYLLLVPLVEEVFKLFSSYSERSFIRAFALVSTYGVWELFLDKSLLFAIYDHSAALMVLAHMGVALPAVFLHLITAAIYAFRFRGRPELQLAICLLTHVAFNAAATVSLPLALISLFPLGLIALLLIPARGTSKRGAWHDAAPAIQSQR